MSTTVPFWGDAPEAWDKPVINGTRWPGKSVVQVTAASGLDLRKAPKQHYMRIVDQGYVPARGTITVTLGFEGEDRNYSDARSQWELWQDVYEQIRPRKARVRKAFTASHPALTMNGITAIYFNKIGPLRGDGPGVRTITLQWIEESKIVSAASGSVSRQRVPVRSTDILTLDRNTPTPPSEDPSSTGTGPPE